MKKLISILNFSLILTSALQAQTYSGDTWSGVKSKGNGSLVLVHVETPSFVYKDKGGALTGICVDVMNDFVGWLGNAKSITVKTEYAGDGSSFRGMYDKVKASQGGVIGLGNITITEVRTKEVKFSPPFITNFAILISQSTVPTLTSMDDFAKVFSGLNAYAARGTTNEKRMLDLKKDYYPDMKIIYATTSQEVLENILKDPKGYAYIDLAFYLEAIQTSRNIKRHPVGDKAAEQFGFIMPLNSDWNAPLEEFFAANGGYLNSPKYRSILVKHLGETGVKLLRAAH